MATRYANGYVPDHELVTLDSGNGAHRSTRASAARWYQLRANVQRKYGKTLKITYGWGTPRDENAYRKYSSQQYARNQACREGNCNAAASPGYSSHGGTWRSFKYTGGQWVDAMAFDIGNYWEIGQENFYREAEAVGFRAGLITPELAGIFEPWHIIDFTPYSGGSTAGNGSTPFEPGVDMTPEESKTLYEIKQILSETQAFKGIGLVVSETHKLLHELKPIIERTGEDTTVTRQLLQETQQWMGIDQRLTEVYKLTQAIAAKPVIDAEELAVAVANAVLSQVGDPDVVVNIDYEKIANDVRAKFKTEPLS